MTGMPDVHVSLPARPITAVLVIVIRDGQTLLVQRANPPDAGLWGFPGGKVEFGESLLAAAERELLEETGVSAVARQVIDAVDAYDRFADGRLRQHFVLIAVQCQWQQGEPVADDDAMDAKWVPIQDMESSLILSRDVAAVARQAALLA
ncbi:ADP-ribose pyrophosphatase YjhB, NUDIX family [Paracoccus alcaliphilus]|uniref:ADP-ribose pyrophosphatase YjhB, NUDIX family n=2 Tax=Paracoccus alcaliphilus TaxID=34002 RepID=A0A1H8EHK6_9RHOB|nr:NUDIX hydrolase [Paracoccus alcaliphilus]SEN18870.1 ADP-ribose pyrophosphatase YjhB, NUDIX family [Paracoccus alcaliphilus]